MVLLIILQPDVVHDSHHLSIDEKTFVIKKHDYHVVT
jgi:hypothetical protein